MYDPLGFNAINLLVKDGNQAVTAGQKAGFVVMGEISIYGCREIWLKNKELNLSIEFMEMPPVGYLPGADPERDRPRVKIYGLDGTENLYFE